MRIRIFTLLLSLWSAVMGAVPLVQAAEVIQVARLAEVVTPVQADFIAEALLAANRLPAKAFILELDTPGGLDTAMRTIIQAIFDSDIPVIVYVGPSGARAASAGALITLAADFAVMASGTNLGAAHPVNLGGGSDQDETMRTKVLNDAVAYARSLAEKRGRNVDWAERMVRESISTSAAVALELKVIDLIAENRRELLNGLEGRVYLRHGQIRVLSTEGAELVELEMNWRRKILASLSNPTVAYMLLMLGMLGIFFEISQPGVILPGAVGALALLLALFAFQTLPINFVGVLLMLLALVLFILEIKVVSYGMLSVGGMLALTLGSLMLIDSPAPYLQISRPVIVLTVLVGGALVALVFYFVVRVQSRRFVSGAEGMVGERGRAVTDIAPEGRVFVHGEYWLAHSSRPIGCNTVVQVMRVGADLRLEVVAVVEDGVDEEAVSTDKEVAG